MNNPFSSYFNFCKKDYVIAFTAAVLSFILILIPSTSQLGWGIILGSISVLLVNAYVPPTKKSTPKTHTDDASETPQDDGSVKTIFVGNLAFKANKQELNKLFSEHGQVHSVRLMTDRATRKPRGFGFVEMSAEDAGSAIEALDEYEFFGRQLRVNEANERRPRNEA